MSYDIYLRSEKCPACGRGDSGPECPDPTYNLTAIFDFALTGEALPNPDKSEAGVVLFGQKTDRPRGLRLLSKKRAKDTAAMLQAACERLDDPALASEFQKFEPENRWGTYEGAREVMKTLRRLAHDYPDHLWEVH